MATRADWDAKFGSGLRTEYDFTIYAATFGTDLAYNNGETYLLILTGVDEDGGESTEMLSLGDGWESKDGGFTVVHEKKAIVNKQSAYGKWCAYAADCPGAEFLYDKNPDEAAIWANTKWHLEERETSAAWTNKAGDTVPARSRLVPVTFLGFDGEAAQSPSPAAKPDRKAELLAKAAANVTAASNGSVPSHVAKAIALVKEHDNYGDFVNAALGDPDILADDKLAESIIDSGASGFYATNR